MNSAKQFQSVQSRLYLAVMIFMLATGSGFATPVVENLKNPVPSQSASKPKPPVDPESKPPVASKPKPPVAPKPRPTDSAQQKESASSDSKKSTYEVIADGVGSTKEAAIKDGLRAAVNQVVGILLISKDRVENDQLIESKVLTYCDGFVESHKLIGEPTKDGPLFKIRMKAVVRKGKLSDSLQSAGISTREVDAGSMMGEAVTVAEQQKSAEEMTADLFDGFPSNVYKVEALSSFKVSGDGDGIVIEVPVKVSIDLKLWKAWAAKADKVLGAIALEKGTVPWNLKGSDFCSLPLTRKELRKGIPGEGGRKGDKIDKISPSMAGFDWEDLSAFRDTAFRPFFYHLIPDSCANGTVLFNGKRGRIPLPTSKYTVTILDAPNGKSKFYILPEDCFAISESARSMYPTIDIELLDQEGESLGSKIVGWEQVIPAKTVGQQDVIVFHSGGNQGGRLLFVSEGESGGNFIAGPSITYSDLPLFSPALLGYNTNNYVFLFCQSVVFPFRFRLDAEETAANPKPTVNVVVGRPEKISFRR